MKADKQMRPARSALALGILGLLGLASGTAVAAVRIDGQVQAGGGPVAGSTVTLWAGSAGEPKQLAHAKTSADGSFALGTDETPGPGVQNKADIGAAIARQWFDAEKVDMVVGFDNSAVALAVEQLAAERNRIAIAGAVGSTAFTGKACTATEASWIYDSYALTTSLARSVVAEGRDTWFFLTVDYAFGHSLEADATNAVLAAGGKVLGSVRHPLNTSDFSSYLLQAQASGAKVVALANGGGDMVNAIKQANEFGITRRGQSVVSLLVFISDIHSIGLQNAQGLKFATAFYWDRDEASRAWSKRFFARHQAMPTQAQASVYSAIRHYLKAIAAAGTDEAKAVMVKMRDIPVDDFYVKNGRLREDGRLVHDMYFAQVKKPSESKDPWDDYNILGTIRGATAFRSLKDGGCPLARQ